MNRLRSIICVVAGVLLLAAVAAAAGCASSPRVDSGSGTATSGLPVMYEFYTDW